jgi:predicted amidohydrolase
MEKTGGPKVHNTAPIIGKDGSILGLYRKRRPISTEKTEPGTTNFLFETEFGTVAVMICFDVENDDILKEVLAQKPFMILNPVHIPAPTRFVVFRRPFGLD